MLGHQLPKPALLKNKDGELIGAGIAERSLAQSWLFPSDLDYTGPLPSSRKAAVMPGKMSWVDENLNEEQKVRFSVVVAIAVPNNIASSQCCRSALSAEGFHSLLMDLPGQARPSCWWKPSCRS